VAAIDDAGAVGQDEVVDHPGPEPVREAEALDRAVAQLEHLAQVLGGEDALPDREEVPHPLHEAHLHQRGVDRRAAGQRLGRHAEAHHRLRAADLEPEALRTLGQLEERTGHAAHGAAERRGRARRRGDRALPQHRLAHREALLDGGRGQPELEPLAPEVGVPDRLLEEEVGGRGRARELLGERVGELAAEQAAHQRHHQSLGQRAVVAVAAIERQHQAVVVLDHRHREPAQPLAGHAAELGVEHDDRAGLEPPPHREHGPHRRRPVEPVVAVAAGGRHRHDAEIAESRGHRGGGLHGRGLVDVDDRRGLARAVGVEPRAHRRRHRGQGWDRPGGGEAHHHVGAAQPLDRGVDLVGQGDRVHQRVRCAMRAR
jgi:hypothetical protein